MNTLANRNNNPGNIKDTSTGKFKVFSTPEEGYAALLNDLQAKKSGKSTTGVKPTSSLADFSNTYAPKSDKNDPAQYTANLANHMGVSPDTKIQDLDVGKWAEAIANAEGYKDSTSINQQDNTQSDQKMLTFDDIQGASSSPQDLKAGTDYGTVGNVANTLAGFTGGQKLSQGLGYSLSNAMGTQKGLLNAQNQAMDIQSNLIQQIRKNKAQGKDTSRLEKALADISQNIQNTGSQASDVGTGGLKSKDILKSAGSLALLPALAYGSSVLKGTSTLPSFQLGTKTALNSPVVTKILTSNLGPGETIANLSKKEAATILETHLKEMALSGAGGKEEQAVLQALASLNPELITKAALLPTIAKRALDTAKTYLLVRALGKGGKLIHDIIK